MQCSNWWGVKKLSHVCETAKNLSIIQGSDDNDCNVNVVAKGGGIAQLGERLHGMQEVIGSIPFTSTKVC